MDIACPNCAATYRVPDSLLARGIALRCASCDHAWVPEVVQSVVPEVVQSVVEPPGMPEPGMPEPGMPEPGMPEPAPLLEGEARLAAAPEVQAPSPTEPPRANPLRSPPPTTPPALQRRHPAGVRPAEGHAPPRRRAKAALRLAWLASILLVTLSVFAVFTFGEQIATAWPPFERVQALLRS
ncbi:MAG: zinc-ribbon domain-containing protein [Roseococcus sp.]|nr:zinc-ribbon domain-containing protein [Roseococcus sp.]